MRVGAVGTKASIQFSELELPLPPEVPTSQLPMLKSEKTPVWRCELGTLGPGESVAKLAYFIITMDKSEEEKLLVQITELGFELIDDTYQYWHEWAGRTVSVECSQPEVGALLAIEKYLCAVQQAHQGGFSPMDGYSYTWVRDSNGPIRYLTACGDFEATRRHLEYHFGGCAQQGEIGNNLPLNLNLSEPPTEPDWASVPVEPAEVPSFVILQHYWYYRQSGDLELIRRHWPYLRRCLLGQAVDEAGRLPFHGDETYRFPGYRFFQAGREVTDYVSLEARSADSAFEYVAAAEALREADPDFLAVASMSKWEM